MFIITKTFTDDEGHLFTKVNPKQYSTPGEAYDAMREDYLNELKSRGLEDNGSSNDDGESCPGGYIISDGLKSTILPNTPRMNSFFLLFCSESIGLVKENRNG
jgi:hypothetical protein